MKKKYLVFTVQAYEMETPDGSLLNMCSLELICDSEVEALKRAKNIIVKKYYRLARVFENFYDKS